MTSTRIALIPAYEPEQILPDLVKEAADHGFAAVVVNDGSSLQTAWLFRHAARYGIVLNHPQNRGKGCALKTGLDYIRKHFPPGYVVVTMDADGQHTVADAERVCRAAQQSPDRLILGSRRLKGSVPLRSRFGNGVTRWVYRLTTGLRLHDTQTGLRAFSSRLVPEMLEIPGERYEYEMNVLLACPRRHIPIEEVEIETIYLNGNEASHFDTLRDSYRIYKEILKFSAASFASFLVDFSLYSLLSVATAGLSDALSLTVSNVGARIVSGCVNYTLNRRLVFESKAHVGRSALQYLLLAGAILLGNTLVLNLLADTLGMNRYAAKLLTELAFFLLSWAVQRSVIFRKGSGGPEHAAQHAAE